MRSKSRRPIAAKAVACLFALCLLLALPCAAGPSARAAGGAPSRFIAIVYDDSGSMRYQGGRDILKNYIYANYSLQNLVALMDDSDSAKVYLISKDGKNPIEVKKQKNLVDEFKGVSAVVSGDTFAGTVNAAFKDGAAFLRDNADGRFLFILITDGDTMYDDQDKQITGSLKELFSGYIRQNGLDAQNSRTRALLLSIGTDKLLAPVSDMETTLMQAGIYTQPFAADIIGKSQTVAGDHIRSAMTDLAESMAGTNMMTVEPGKPFTVRYPLESMVVMEQSQRGSAIKSISGGGEELTRTTLYQTRALRGVNLYSTFSSVTSKKGPVKPGSYTLQATGNVKVAVFSKVGFTPDITLADEAGRKAAEYRDNRWSVPDVSLRVGEKLTAVVKFKALDGTDVDIGPYVQLGFGKADAFSCSAMGQGMFDLRGVSEGRGYLDIGLSDSDYFQLSIPALPVKIVSANAEITLSPESSPQPSAAASAQTGAPSGSLENPAFDAESLLNMPGNNYTVEYTSSREYVQGAEILLPGIRSAQLRADVSPAPPKGLQIRFNGVVFDSNHASGTVGAAETNKVELFANADFAATGRQLYELRFNSGETLSIYITPKPRALRIEASPARLEFGVMDGSQAAPSCSWNVSIQENGQWRDASAADLVSVKAESPGGLSAQCDGTRHTLRVSSGWPQAFSPVGESAVLLSASTGKPGESASLNVSVLVRDDARRWLWLILQAIALLAVSGYAILIVRKRRIPLETEAYAGDNADLSGSSRVELTRNMAMRNFWPFGREVCALGLLEIYPHAKDRGLVVLSSVAVQYGLKIDGKAPQYHKNRDKSGDFVIGPDNVVSVRENGAFRTYKIINPGLKVKKAGKTGGQPEAR